MLQGFSHIGGIDEAGRGPLAGPVVAAVCILPLEGAFLDLDDSKKLKPQKRQFLFEELKRREGVFFALGIADVSEIDRINILQASFLAMQRAVKRLSITPDYLLIDGNFSPYFPCPTRAIIGGDGISLSIAAASIIAKVSRDRMMQQIDQKYPQYGFCRHKGYGTREHFEALERFGPSPHHRASFAPVRALTFSKDNR